MLKRRTQQIKEGKLIVCSVIKAGSRRPFSGVLALVHSTSEDEHQHSSQPGRSISVSSRVVCNQGASERHEYSQQANWHPISPDRAQE